MQTQHPLAYYWLQVQLCNVTWCLSVHSRQISDWIDEIWHLVNANLPFSLSSSSFYFLHGMIFHSFMLLRIKSLKVHHPKNNIKKKTEMFSKIKIFMCLILLFNHVVPCFVIFFILAACWIKLFSFFPKRERDHLHYCVYSGSTLWILLFHSSLFRQLLIMWKHYI